MSTWASWQVTRRADAARWVLLLAFVVLGGGFFQAQVLQSKAYRLTSTNNRLRTIPLPAPRGEIVDRNGLLIAENVPGYSVRLLAPREDSLRAVVARLDALIPGDSIDADEVVRRWSAARYEPALVLGSSDFGVVATLEEHRGALPGLVIQAEPRRHYPLGAAVGHLVGYVSEVSQAELDNATKFPGARMGDIVGKLGLEAEYDSIMRGRNGMRYVEVTARGHTVREQSLARAVRPTIGRTITTTIDLPLQEFVDSMWQVDLPGKRGALLAMRPNGEILAYYSAPAFDPNDWVGGISVPKFRELNENPDKPLINRVIYGRYPPASPFKLATAAMGLKRGLITANTRMAVPCTGGYQFGNRRFRCWKRDGGHGSLDLTGAVATSCDVYFYQLGLMLGEQAIFEEGTAYGFGERSGIDLDANMEQRSIFPSGLKSYVNSRGVNWWSRGEILNLSIGQGNNAQTLVNMTTFYAALAGDGIKRAPYLVRPRPGAEAHDLGLTPGQLQVLRDAMSAVVNSGTAGASGGRDIRMAGKTGTGQVTGQEDIAWFIGFAPVEAPEIIVGILVEEGLHGSWVAPQVARTIRRWILGPDTAAVRAPLDLPITEELLPADSLRLTAPADSALVRPPATGTR
jgi:penicillin-binding protein 2